MRGRENVSGGIDAPSRPEWTTVPEMLRIQAAAHPDRLFVRVLKRGEQTETCTYGQLWNQAGAWASLMRSAGLRRGEAVVIVLPTSAAFVATFFGVLMAGGVPAPLAPPRRIVDNAYWDTVAQRAHMIGARFVVSPHRLDETRSVDLANLPGRVILTPGDVRADSAAQRLETGPSDLALLQFTSGTLGGTKAVELTNGALVAQTDAIRRVLELDPHVDSAVSWLPLFHDMGLIGFLLTPAAAAGHVTLLPPDDFMLQPRLWIRAVAEYGATIMGGPPSAYALCARQMRADEAAKYDLRHVRVALVGAEQISAESLQSFLDRFEAVGFRRTSFVPTYGLAENGLAVTMTRPGRGAEFDHVSADALETRGAAIRADGRDDRVRVVAAVGAYMPGVSVAVTDAAGRRLGERRVGEILVRGPSVMRGYHGQPEATRAALRDGWLATGDLGYVVGDALYVTGRSKEVVIVGGRNYAPDDIEALAAGVPGVRRRRAVAFGVWDPERATDAVIVVVETAEADPAQRDALRLRVREAVVRGGCPVHRVVLVAPHTIRTTHTGKLVRTECKERFLRGELPDG